MATAAYTLSMTQAEAFDYTRGAIEGAGAVIGSQLPPNRIDFALTLTQKELGSVAVPMPGYAIATPLPDGQVNVTLTVDAASSYVVYALGIGLIALLLGNVLFGGLGGLWFVLVAAAVGYGIWALYMKLPGDALALIGAKMRASSKVTGGGPAAPAGAPIVTTPPAPPPPPKPEPQAPAPESTSTLVITPPPPEPPPALPAPGDATPKAP
jgi:hypothetical protein